VYKVRAVSPDDEQMYPGRLKEDKGNGMWTVAWDDPDGGPETNDISESNIKKLYFFTDYAVGDDCRAISPDDERWYPGTVAEILSDNKFRVKWDDPDEGAETSDLHYEVMKKVKIKRDYKEGDEVLAAYPDDGTMYEGKVVKQNDDGTFQVKWDDPDGGPETSDISPKEMKVPPIPFDDLKVGDKYTGVVDQVRESFAFVDIGTERSGFLHVSKVSEERGANIGDFLEEEQEITVWISGVSDDGKFGLTMIEGKVDPIRRPPSDVDAFAALSPDDWYEGVVDRVAPFGAFIWVELEDGSGGSGLCHVSQISPEGEFVDNVNDFVKQGEKVKVRIIRVDQDQGKISMSRKEGGGGFGGGGPREVGDVSAFEGVEGWLDGKVVNTIQIGAFVEITAPDGAVAQGMVHVSRMGRGFVENAAEELSIGDEVKVRVTNVDTVAGKIDLSMEEPE
jgi:predicted RNA-binding protein with RPS1 domain